MDSIVSLLKRLDQLNEIGVSLSRERDINRLLENILVAAKDITHADGGTLYRVTEDGKALRFEIMRTQSLGIAKGGTASEGIDLPTLPLHLADGKPNDSLVAAYAAIHHQTVNIADAYTEPNFDFSGTKQFDQRTGYHSQSFLAVPMKNHEGELIGVLQLINAIDPATGKVVPFHQADQSLAESLASQAAIAITNRDLVIQLETLFEAFIGLINLAVDEKSQHTGGHCQRVPELTLMIADAVNAAQDGPMATFRMSERDRYELKIAALLHDCGKVTTPVHVVDKATKLQTLFDRADLIQTRFEVVRRDAQVKALEAKLAAQAHGVDGLNERLEAIDAAFQATSREIDADWEFVQAINRGGEAMREEDIQRVRDLRNKYQWTVGESEPRSFLTEDELENLSIRAGTLTGPEREIINHHIVATIKMLEQLPWPKHLKHVPEFAGGHHERMDGKGYPKGLKRDEMSVQARIMGIADIFEALTAKDRPYKQGMKLSQAMQIMAKFKAGGHIDPDLFDVFAQSKVYLQYAQQFLDPWQIDEVGALN
ncbi:MAG: GAF domain-containing protein [Rhodoferax sp.]|nr:MAG: GAF domain-containing protein [Rhodoferax sp.]